MKRVWLLAISSLLIALHVAFRPAEGQDDLQDRVSAPETQVADLQAVVGSDQASPSGPAITHTITGSITLYGDKTGAYIDIFVSSPTNTCWGENGYDDIRAGGAVTIRDGDDETIAVGRLDEGKPVTGGCEFPFTVNDVPDRDFYSIEVTHRGQVFASREELAATGWNWPRSLGNR